MADSQALVSRLPRVNEAVSRRYTEQTNNLTQINNETTQTDDKPTISQDRYASQMAALVPYIEQDRLGAAWTNARWLRERKAALKKSRPA